MAQNRFYSSVAFPTFLTSSIASSGNPQVASIAGLPGSYPFTMLIDWGLTTQEAISVTSAPTGTGPYTLPCTRGVDGTTAQSHAQNAIVVHGVSAQDYNEPQVHISLGTSGAGINQIHGLANGSAVVGTTDAQTLTNKTLGAWTGTGDIGISVNEAAGPILTITNTHSAPTAAIVRLVANAAADTTSAIRVAGDTVNRYQIDSNGKIQWGAGGASALDTNLYRQGAGILQTDTAFVAASVTASEAAAAGNVASFTNTQTTPTGPVVNVQSQTAGDRSVGLKVSGDTNHRLAIDSTGKAAWGPGNATQDTNLYRQGVGVVTTDNTLTALLGAQLGNSAPTFGGGTGGVLGIKNATAVPNTTVANGVVLYANNGLLQVANTAGFNQVIAGSQLGGTVVYANSVTETAMATVTIPANDPIIGAVYTLQGMGILSTTGSPTVIWKTRYGGTAGTSLATTAAITQGTGVTNVLFNFQVLVMFTSTTAAMCSMNVNYQTAAGTTTTQNYQQTTAPVTVTTSGSAALVFTATWSAASASNTMTSWYSAERIS